MAQKATTCGGQFGPLCIAGCAAGAVAGAALALLWKSQASKAPKQSESASLEDGLTLKYFDLPALGEPARILLALSGKQWVDARMSRDAWKKEKAASKFGQMPLLITKGGETVAQSAAIARYLAKCVSVDGAGALYPACPKAAAAVDELIDTFNDFHKNFYKTSSIKDQAEKEAARVEYMTGDGAKLLAVLEGGANGVWMVGDRMTLADVWVFYFISFYLCGFWDGVAADAFEAYPKMMAIRKKVAAMPALVDYYTKLGEATWPGVSYDAFKPLHEEEKACKT